MRQALKERLQRDGRDTEEGDGHKCTHAMDPRSDSEASTALVEVVAVEVMHEVYS